MRLSVKVIPKSSKNTIVGWENGYLKIRLHAVPEKGEANEELIAFLSDILNIPKSRILLLRGHAGRLKQLELVDFTEEELKVLLSK